MISERDFASIRTMVEQIVTRLVGNRQSYFSTGTVIRRDEKKNLVWLKEYGSQAIPVVGFNYDVIYYDTDAAGIVRKKKAKVTVHVPNVGAKVVVANEWGLKRLPRCIGVIQGRGWMESE